MKRRPTEIPYIPKDRRGSRYAPREGGKMVADFMLLPLRSMALQVPELRVLELPFFYTGIAGVQRALQGPLAGILQQTAYTIFIIMK